MGLLIDVLATRRLVRLVVEDQITFPLRKAVADYPALDYLINCRSCSSVWAAGVVTLLPRRVRYVLAASEGAILVGSVASTVERFGL